MCVEAQAIISLLTVICGADSFVAIETYARSRKEWPETFLIMFAALNPVMLAEAFRRWTEAIASGSKERLIAIDGKTLQRTFKQAGDGPLVGLPNPRPIGAIN